LSGHRSRGVSYSARTALPPRSVTPAAAAATDDNDDDDDDDDNNNYSLICMVN
jgi:hypothetical protein